MAISGYAGLVLAAGKGTRMHSQKPKVLHTLLGSLMLGYVLEALRPLVGENLFTVVGHGAEMVRAAFPGDRFIVQKEQLGTGHALFCAMPEIASYEYALVANGDAPLLSTGLLRKFIDGAAGCDVAFASMELDDPAEYGRVQRKDGRVAGIVEARELGQEAQTTREVNAGIYLLRLGAVEGLLAQMGNSNKSGEYYITDLIGLGVARGLDVRAINCGGDEDLAGINTPAELARMEERLRARTVEELQRRGVLIHAPHLARISPHARIEPGAEISGPCEIYGACEISGDAQIFSNTVLLSSRVARGAQIRNFCHLEEASVGPGCLVGPFARLRPGAALEENAHIGNFVEMKKAVLGAGSKANHLTYLGDAEIGPGVNIGAGTITCNYDGRHKYKTTIGAGAFIGSNTALVAPVAVGENALVGAGSVITRDVPADELGIGRARQKNLPRKNGEKA